MVAFTLPILVRSTSAEQRPVSASVTLQLHAPGTINLEWLRGTTLSNTWRGKRHAVLWLGTVGLAVAGGRGGLLCQLALTGIKQCTVCGGSPREDVQCWMGMLQRFQSAVGLFY